MSTRLLNQVTGLPFSDRGVRVTNTTARDGENMLVASNVAALTVKAPAAPGVNATFCVTDADGNAGTNNITVDGNGNTIDGDATVLLDIAGAAQEFLFDRGQWRKVTEARRIEERPDRPFVMLVGPGPAAGAAVASVAGAAPITSSGGANPTIGIVASSALVPGSMSAAQFTKLAALPTTPVTAVTGTAPIASSGGATPAISIAAAAGPATAGSMSGADKAKLDDIQKQGATTAMPALDVDWSLSGTYSKTLAAGANALTFSNTVDGKLVIVAITGSASTLTFPAGIIWPAGTVPTQTAAGTDVYTFIKIDASIVATVLQDVK